MTINYHNKQRRIFGYKYCIIVTYKERDGDVFSFYDVELHDDFPMQMCKDLLHTLAHEVRTDLLDLDKNVIPDVTDLLSIAFYSTHKRCNELLSNIESHEAHSLIAILKGGEDCYRKANRGSLYTMKIIMSELMESINSKLMVAFDTSSLFDGYSSDSEDLDYEESD